MSWNCGIIRNHSVCLYRYKLRFQQPCMALTQSTLVFIKWCLVEQMVKRVKNYSVLSMSIRWIILVMSLKRGRGFVVSKHNVSSHHCGKPTPSFDSYLEASGDTRGHCCDVHLYATTRSLKEIGGIKQTSSYSLKVDFVGVLFLLLDEIIHSWSPQKIQVNSKR